MGFSPLAKGQRIPDMGRSSPRNTHIQGFTIHHQAGVNAHGQATAPGREVSANYWITNDGTILPNVDELRRAWTTGAAGYPGGADADHRNITVEVSNSPEGVRTGSWAISEAAEKALSALIGDVFKRHNLGTPRRGTNGGVAVHQDFVPTQCPGPYIMTNLTRIIRNAAHSRKDEDMTPEQARMLKELHTALVTPITRGGKKVSPRQDVTDTGTMVRDLHTQIMTPVTRGGKKVPVRQDNADTNTLVRQILQRLERLEQRMK